MSTYLKSDYTFLKIADIAEKLRQRLFEKKRSTNSKLSDAEKRELKTRELFPPIAGLTTSISGSIMYLFDKDTPIPMHGNFVGPYWTGGRELKKNEKITRVDLEVDAISDFDAAAKIHDIAYAVASSVKDKTKRDAVYKKADQDFIKKLENATVDKWRLALSALETALTLYSFYATSQEVKRVSAQLADINAERTRILNTSFRDTRSINDALENLSAIANEIRRINATVSQDVNNPHREYLRRLYVSRDMALDDALSSSGAMLDESFRLARLGDAKDSLLERKNILKSELKGTSLKTAISTGIQTAEIAVNDIGILFSIAHFTNRLKSGKDVIYYIYNENVSQEDLDMYLEKLQELGATEFIDFFKKETTTEKSPEEKEMVQPALKPRLSKAQISAILLLLDE